jgi:hypothetical protein
LVIDTVSPSITHHIMQQKKMMMMREHSITEHERAYYAIILEIKMI